MGQPELVWSVFIIFQIIRNVFQIVRITLSTCKLIRQDFQDVVLSFNLSRLCPIGAYDPVGRKL
jgi:hypothetical protein